MTLYIGNSALSNIPKKIPEWDLQCCPKINWKDIESKQTLRKENLKMDWERQLDNEMSVMTASLDPGIKPVPRKIVGISIFQIVFHSYPCSSWGFLQVGQQVIFRSFLSNCYRLPSSSICPHVCSNCWRKITSLLPSESWGSSFHEQNLT